MKGLSLREKNWGQINFWFKCSNDNFKSYQSVTPKTQVLFLKVIQSWL